MKTETWARYGACRNTDPETFFDCDGFVDGHMTNNQVIRENAERRLRAKLVCSTCPVQNFCLQDAYDTDDQLSVRAGFTPRERAALREGQVVADYGYNIKVIKKGFTQRRGFDLVRRFAAGERIADLAEEYGLKRSTALQEIRLQLVLGSWREEDEDLRKTDEVA